MRPYLILSNKVMRRRNIQFFIFFGIMLFIINLSQVEAATPFTARNGKIFYPGGHELKIIGVNIDLHGMDHHSPRFISDLSMLKDKYNINFTRTYEDTAASESMGASVLDFYDRYVNEATRLGIVTEFEWHGVPGKIYTGAELEQARGWYRMMASRYKNNPYVWFGSINESGGASSGISQDTWFNSIKVIHNAVRAGGYTGPFLIDDCNWGAGSTSSYWESCIIINKERIIGLGSNLVAAPHVYTGAQVETTISGLAAYRTAGFEATVVEETGAYEETKHYILGLRAAVQASYDGVISGVVLYAWTDRGTFYGPLSTDGEALWKDFTSKFLPPPSVGDLIAQWNFNNTSQDSSGHENHSTLYNGAFYSSDSIEGTHALQLDGNDDYASVAHSSILDLGYAGDSYDSYSVALWYKRNGPPPGRRGIVGKDDGNGRYPFRLNTGRDGKAEFVVFDGSNVSRIESQTTITTNSWKHVVIVRDKKINMIKIYVDGQEDAAPVVDATATVTNTDTIWLGRNELGGTYYHDAIKLDDVQIYNRALSAAEIELFYKGGETPVSPSPPMGLQVRIEN